MSLRELNVECLADLSERLPKVLNETQACWALAGAIIIRALGQDLWRRALHGDLRSENLFGSSKSNVLIIYLADLIWKLRDTPGFEVLLTKNCSRSFESTFFELSAADPVDEVSDSVEFVVPTGVRGRDYDMRAFGYMGFDEAAIEFKCRREPFTSEKMLRNFLRITRSQFPSGGNGVLHCFIPTIGHCLSQQEFIIIVSDWLRSGTTRVKRVVIHWEQVPEVATATVRMSMTIGPDGRAKEPKRDLDRYQGREWKPTVTFLRDVGRSLLPVNPQTQSTNIRWQGMEVTLGTWSSRDWKWWTVNRVGLVVTLDQVTHWKPQKFWIPPWP